MLRLTIAQFVHEMGVHWDLVAASAVMVLMPEIVVTTFGQKYLMIGLDVLESHRGEVNEITSSKTPFKNRSYKNSSK